MTRMMLATAALLGTVSLSSAETVEVKYRGPVPLDSFTCPALKPSSFVNRICYDAAERYLIVQLKQTYYHYCELPQAVFEGWVAAPSLGRFYNQEVKGGVFDCRGKALPEYP